MTKEDGATVAGRLDDHFRLVVVDGDQEDDDPTS